jgi:death on curing protein
MAADDSGDLVYLGVDDVIGIHADVMGYTDATAAGQLRDEHALESALARPLSHAHYSGADIAQQAAVLAHGIAESQLFVDGNKRTALAAMRTFLKINGYGVRASQAERASWILDFADGRTVEDVASRVRGALDPPL